MDLPSAPIDREEKALEGFETLLAPSEREGSKSMKDRSKEARKVGRKVGRKQASKEGRKEQTKERRSEGKKESS